MLEIFKSYAEGGEGEEEKKNIIEPKAGISSKQ
jgi:hypothetical protein